MLGVTWLKGTARRPGRGLATIAGIALAVGLLGSLGSFLASSKATMTRRSVQAVAIDWQVEGSATASKDSVAKAVARNPHVVASRTVDFAPTSGLSATIAGSQQSTGPGMVLGIPDGYRSTFPKAIRTLAGAPSGVLLAQQTAANLRVGVGGVVMIGRAGLPPAPVTVDGIVDLPQADSLFQKVGAPPGSGATAPPDNVLLLTANQFNTVEGPAVVTAGGERARFQVHARLDHRLADDPSAAYGTVTGAAHNLEAKLAGAGQVGDNLASTLSSARQDALYAQLLFLFLGAPGAVLAALLTVAVAGSGADRRRAEQALLRARGASIATLVRLAVLEAGVVGVIGSLLGLGVAGLVGYFAFGHATFGAATATALVWAGGAALAGVVIALAALAWPARRDARDSTVAGARQPVAVARPRRWMRWGLDGWCLAGGAAVAWVTGRQGYQLVLAPEGVPSISVSYWAFAGPALIWVGAGLLSLRLVELLLTRGRPALRWALRPLAGNLSAPVASTLGRQRRLLARSAALLALAVAFAASTAVFNETYRQQARVDATLANGADVNVSAPPGAGLDPSLARTVAATPGVASVEPVQHRYAYVGADLQDLYGVNAQTIGGATKLVDPYFSGGSARQILGRLRARPDGVLVSQETATDFQLHLGDQVTLRLQNRDKQYQPVTFHYVGVVKEFPTAPRDSFLVANSAYVKGATGSGTVGTFLVTAGGSSPSAIAGRLGQNLGTTATVTPIGAATQAVGSSLTAVDLGGLTRVELGFAVVVAAAAAGLVLWLGLAERRRTFALASVLGAKPRQLAGFVWSEAAVITTVGLIAGAVLGGVLSQVLVVVLRGVFDPPPDTLSIPGGYLTGLLAVIVASVAIASLAAVRNALRPPITVLRSA